MRNRIKYVALNNQSTHKLQSVTFNKLAAMLKSEQVIQEFLLSQTYVGSQLVAYLEFRLPVCDGLLGCFQCVLGVLVQPVHQGAVGLHLLVGCVQLQTWNTLELEHARDMKQAGSCRGHYLILPTHISGSMHVTIRLMSVLFIKSTMGIIHRSSHIFTFSGLLNSGLQARAEETVDKNCDCEFLMIFLGETLS